MKVVLQRCKYASCTVDNKLISEINHGLTLFVGFKENDTLNDLDTIIKKIIHLRIFNDDAGLMNKSILETGGSILSISQFTLFADTKKGNRPSFAKALNSEKAADLYQQFNQKLSEFVLLKTGIFGADMLINLENDGPVTILLDSKE